MRVQALAKIEAKHKEVNVTLSIVEYEEILDALTGSHFQPVSPQLSHSTHEEIGQLLLQVITACCSITGPAVWWRLQISDDS